MGQVGRKPKPTPLHRLQGTYRPDRHGKRATEPQAPATMDVAPPAYLTPDQQIAWRFAITNAPAGVLRQIDTTLLRAWVEADDRHRRAMVAQAEFESRNPRFPLLRLNKKGEPVVSPYIREIDRATERLLSLAGELGFSPTARPRLAQRDGESPLSVPTTPWTQLRVLRGGKA